MTEFMWVIEAPGAMYLAARQIGHQHDFHWAKEPDDALRFVSKQQGESVMYGLRALDPDLFGFARTLGEAVVREHGWVRT